MSVCAYDRIAAEEYVRTHGFHPTEQWCVPGWRTADKGRIEGLIRQVEYITRKRFEGEKTYLFYHDFTADHNPWLATGQGQFFIVGGGYTVTPHGIEDDDDDPRDIPDPREHEWVDFPVRVPRSHTGMGKLVSFTIETANGKTRRLDFQSAGRRALLTYNPRGAVKTLYVVPTDRAKRTPMEYRGR